MSDEKVIDKKDNGAFENENIYSVENFRFLKINGMYTNIEESEKTILNIEKITRIHDILTSKKSGLKPNYACLGKDGSVKLYFYDQKSETMTLWN